MCFHFCANGVAQNIHRQNRNLRRHVKEKHPEDLKKEDESDPNKLARCLEALRRFQNSTRAPDSLHSKSQLQAVRNSETVRDGARVSVVEELR